MASYLGEVVVWLVDMNSYLEVVVVGRGVVVLAGAELGESSLLRGGRGEGRKAK